MKLDIHNPGVTAILEKPPFDPESISNMRAWYDVSDPAAVSRTAENINTLTDKSGNLNSISQGNGARMPHWIDAVQNSLPIARFTTEDYLEKNNFASGKHTQPNTILVVCKMPTSVNSGVQAWVFSSPTTTVDRQDFFREDVGNTDGYGINADTDLIDNVETIDDTNILLYTLVYDGVSSSIKKSGVEIISGDAGTSQIGGLALNANEPVSIRSGGMDFGELILYNKLLTAQEESDLETYFNTKWGL